MKRDPILKKRARELRVNSTPAEITLWQSLRGGRFGGFKFRRQHVIGKSIADFYCANCALVVELDGESHDGREAEDARRDEQMEWRGLTVLRFKNQEVYENLTGVLDVIWQTCFERCNKNPFFPNS